MSIKYIYCRLVGSHGLVVAIRFLNWLTWLQTQGRSPFPLLTLAVFQPTKEMVALLIAVLRQRCVLADVPDGLPKDSYKDY